MIVREILRNPDLVLDNFDFSNDAKDTAAWLRAIGEEALAERLEKREALFNSWPCNPPVV